jgi:hypothetical protein
MVEENDMIALNLHMFDEAFPVSGISTLHYFQESIKPALFL